MDENKQQEENRRSIELRSEKVRNIVGQIPPVLLRYGIVIVGLVLFILIGISTFLPYKETIAIDAILYTTPRSKMVTAPVAGTVLFDSLPQTVVENQIVAYIRDRNELVPVQAPISGILVLNVSNNERIAIGTTLLAVVPQDVESVYAESEVNGEQLTKIHLRDKVVLSAFQGRTWIGTVSKIYPIATGGGLNRIRIDFSDTNSYKISGTRLEGKIILSELTILKKILHSFH